MGSLKLRTVGLSALVVALLALIMVMALRGTDQSNPGAASGDPETGDPQSQTTASSDGSVVSTTTAGAKTTASGSTTPYTGEPSPVLVEFTASANEGLAPFDVDFVASAATSSGGQIRSYEWSFGDGFMAIGPEVSHTYQASGSYEVRLTVTDSEEFQAAADTRILVTASDDSVGELVDYVIDPGFEIGESGMENYYDKSSTERSTDRPIEGQASLMVNLPGWSDVILPIAYPWREGPMANSLTAEALIRVDAITPDARIELCAVAYWQVDSQEVRHENCVEVGGPEGESQEVSVRLETDPQKRLGRIYFWLSSVGDGEASLTLDDIHLVLDRVEG